TGNEPARMDPDANEKRSPLTACSARKCVDRWAQPPSTAPKLVTPSQAAMNSGQNHWGSVRSSRASGCTGASQQVIGQLLTGVYQAPRRTQARPLALHGMITCCTPRRGSCSPRNRRSCRSSSFSIAPSPAWSSRSLKPDLLIIDDMGMKQLPKRSGEYLFEIIMRRYETRSTMMTSNRPLEDWGKLLGDVPAATAILDRFLHHAEIMQITGKSYRLRQAGRSETPVEEQEAKPAIAPTGSKRKGGSTKPAIAPTGSESEK